MDENVKDIDGNDALIAEVNNVGVESGKWDIPPLNMRSLLLLQKVLSPFTTPGPVKIDPETQAPMIGKNGIPVHEIILPTLQDVAEAYYILKHQDRPDILQIIQDRGTLENCVFQFASEILPADMIKIANSISNAMARLNSAAISAGEDEPTGPKVETGPTST